MADSRNDLRLDDNLALKAMLIFEYGLVACVHFLLEAAVDGAESLLPVFVFDPSRFNVPTLAGAAHEA